MTTLTIELPEKVPSDYYEASWEVPVTCSMTGTKRTGIHAGEIFIRRSDGKIGMSGVSSVIENADDAETLARALLAASEYMRSRNG